MLQFAIVPDSKASAKTSRLKSSRRNQGKRSTIRLQAESLEERRVLTAWHNNALATDVDASNIVAPLDALLVINELVQRVHSEVGTGLLPTERPENAPFLDVNDDGFVAPLDALFVINELGNAVEANVFTILENSAANAAVGRIQPTGGTAENSVFELVKDEAIPADIRDVLELKPDDHYQGAADAPVVMIEYVDFACPTCGIFHTLVQQALEDFDGDIAVVTRHLPLTSLHPNATRAAIAAEAAGRQGKFDEMADLLFTRRVETGWDQAVDPNNGNFRVFAQELGLDLEQFAADLADPALEDRVNRDGLDASSVLNFGGTPSFVVNDLPEFPQPTQASLNQLLTDKLNAVQTPFKIDRFSGDIRVRDGALLDFETTPSYTLDVMVNGSPQTVRIDLTDVPDA